MKKQCKKNTKIKTIKVIVIAVLLILIQYILTYVYRENKTIGLSKKQMLSSTVYVNDDAYINSDNSTSLSDLNEGKYIRLTDLEWRSESRAGWGQLKKNQDNNGDKLSVKREGAYYTFDYGIWAHASSNVYYDISEYSEKYHYLTMYVGLNRTSNTGNGVKFWIYKSNDDVFHSTGPDYWTLISDADRVYMPGQDAVFMKLDIRGAKYIRLQAYDNGANGNDHAVYIDPMLITDDYKEKEPAYLDIEVYDQRIKEYENKDLTDPNYELLILQRKFLSNVGNYALERFIEEEPANKETIDWLMNDVENLRYYILGGKPDGGYYNSLKQLTRLLKEYKSDFEIQDQISSAGKEILRQQNSTMPTTKGNLYKRMAITLSLTHSARVGLWMQNSETNQSDAVNRYAIYKQMYNAGQFKATEAVDITPWFETYNIEEMRYVLGTLIDDEEVLWLNEYTQSRINASPNSAWSLLTPHSYIAYVWPNYSDPRFYAEENDEYFNNLFAVEKDGVKKVLWDDGKGTSNYGMSRGNLIYKLWMNFRNKFGTGAVCGGISKSGHCIRGVHAIPSAVIGQPGHAALLYYTKNSSGQGYWGIDNDVSGWAYSEKGERMPLGWGNDRTYVKGYNIPYVVLAQEALNDYNGLVKTEELLMTVDIYQDDKEKQEQIYREAIEIQSINLDAWVGLTKLYMSDETKTEEDYYNLAKEMMEALKAYPFPMYNLSNYIATKLISDEYTFAFTILQTKMLNEAKNGEGIEVLQPSLTKGLANHLLGQIDTSLASFSFDGADGGKIVLSSRFDGNGVRWDYSLDGKQTWIEVAHTAEEAHKVQLTKKEIKSITSENDIYVHIVGANYNDENIYKIDILESAGLPETLFASDLENRMIAVNLSTEWRYTENEPWTSYSVASPDLTGTKTVQLRQGAIGTHLASNTLSTFNFTEDEQPDTRKYIQVSHLSIHSVSTQATNQGGAATNAIDANFNTRYHSAWNGTDTERFIVVKLDKPVYLSAVEFVPAGGGNGRIIKGTIYGSMTGNGEDWEMLANNADAPFTYPTQANTNEQAALYTKSFEIDEPKQVQYVKIVADQTNGNWFAARAFNFYQDVTSNSNPTAGIAYSTTEKTNKPVIARLVNPSTEITITNNEGKDTYVFTQNGEFTFQFIDENGNEGTTIAKVDWIDKDVPTADIGYKLGDDKKLIAVLDNISEDVYLLDQNNKKTNYIKVEDGKVVSISYLDETGNEYKIAELDENKVTKQISYKNTTGKVENISYYITVLQDGEITSRLGFDEEGNSVTLTEAEIEELKKLEEIRSNPLEHYLEEDSEYEFKLLDKASNITYKNVRVDYIEHDTKILASDITYSNRNITNQDVIATINPYVIDMDGRHCDVIIIEKIIESSDKDREIIEGSAEYTFTENGEYTFKYAKVKEEDGADEEIKTHTAKVDWIDKDIPTAEIRYNTKETTSKEVIATLVNESEDITITNNGNSREYRFTENGEFTFEFVDRAGNKGTAVASVNWIDKTALASEITYSTMELTNQNVIATLTFDDESVTIIGENTHTFTENGSHTFEYRTEDGNVGTIIAVVDWIDKEAPIATVTYSPAELTNKEVIAILSFNENNVAIVGGNGHRFTENGEFTFEFVDKAGNKGTATAKVDWIDKTAPTAEIAYSTREETEQEVVVTLTNASEEITVTNNNGSLEHRFTENGEFTFEFVDKAGNKGTATAKVDWIKEKFKIGDLDGDNKITGNDLAKLQKHLINIKKLTGNSLKAADVDGDGRVTGNDLARIQKALIGLAEI